MKTRKILALLLISLLVFTVTPMLAFAADEVTSVTLNKNSGDSGSTYWALVNSVLSKGGTQIFEAELTPGSSDQEAYIRTEGGSINGASYYDMIYWNGTNLLVGNTGMGAGSNGKTFGQVTKNEKYHILCVMNIPESGKGTMDVYVNGVLVGEDVSHTLTSAPSTASAFWRRMDIKYAGPDYATLSTAPADFTPAKYAASAEAKTGVTNVTVSRNSKSIMDQSGFKIALGERTEKVTKAALLNSLTVSTGATAVLYGADGTTVLGETDYVENGAVLKITSENEKVTNEYDISVTYKWPAVPYTVNLDNSSGTNTAWRTLTYCPEKDDVVVMEYDCVAPAKDKIIQPVQLAINGASKYWYPVEFNNEYINGNVRNGKIKDEGGADRKHIGYYTEGEKFHIVSVLRFDDNTDITASSGTKTTARLFINGVEVITEGPVGVNYSDVYNKFGVGTGNVATLTMYRGMTSIADFDYDDYMANVSVKDDAKGVYVTGGSYNKVVFKNQGITVANSEITTVEELLSALIVNGTASVYENASAVTAMENAGELANGNVLKVTSENAKVTNSYVIKLAEEDAITFTTEADSSIVANVIPSDLSNILFIAGYSDDGELKTLSAVRMGAMADSALKESDTLQAGLTAQEAEGLTIRAFYWTDEMVPIDAEIYSAN